MVAVSTTKLHHQVGPNPSTTGTTFHHGLVVLLRRIRQRIHGGNNSSIVVSHLVFLTVGVLVGKSWSIIGDVMKALKAGISLPVDVAPPPPPPSRRRTVLVNSMCRCSSGEIPVPTRRRRKLKLKRRRRRQQSQQVHTVDTQVVVVVQPPSLARPQSKHFVLEPYDDCTCLEKLTEGHGDITTDTFLRNVGKFKNETDTCTSKRTKTKKIPSSSSSSSSSSSQYTWQTLPELGVEQDLPLFVGVLSYKSPKSLNASLYNWLLDEEHDLFRETKAKGMFLQLNHRSQEDDDVIDEFRQKHLLKEESRRRRNQNQNQNHERSNSDDQTNNSDSWTTTVTGSSQANVHPGLAISHMCRQAERHPSSHPNGENLLLFLEKDWQLRPHNELKYMLDHGNFVVVDDNNDEEGRQNHPLRTLFDSVRTLMQRGVNYVRLTGSLNKNNQNNGGHQRSNAGGWNCPADGVPWICETSHQHRWTNLPLVVKCDWFLRYLEPYALIDDSMMFGCRRGFQHSGYYDWEEAMQDGRIEWTNSQWVVASIVLNGPPTLLGKHGIWKHVEIDQ